MYVVLTVVGQAFWLPDPAGDPEEIAKELLKKK